MEQQNMRDRAAMDALGIGLCPRDRLIDHGQIVTLHRRDRAIVALRAAAGIGIAIIPVLESEAHAGDAIAALLQEGGGTVMAGRILAARQVGEAQPVPVPFPHMPFQRRLARDHIRLHAI